MEFSKFVAAAVFHCVSETERVNYDNVLFLYFTNNYFLGACSLNKINVSFFTFTLMFWGKDNIILLMRYKITLSKNEYCAFRLLCTTEVANIPE
jgi:hypothetical protein